MANKLKNKKPVVKKPMEPIAEAGKDATVEKASVLNGSGTESPKKDVFNAETAQVLRDTAAGKNLTRYVDEDDLFRKLGIKIGKA
jgi:hypothetical protein